VTDNSCDEEEMRHINTHLSARETSQLMLPNDCCRPKLRGQRGCFIVVVNSVRGRLKQIWPLAANIGVEQHGELDRRGGGR
jgi:hypothetical protein